MNRLEVFHLKFIARLRYKCHLENSSFHASAKQNLLPQNDPDLCSTNVTDNFTISALYIINIIKCNLNYLGSNNNNEQARLFLSEFYYIA